MKSALSAGVIATLLFPLSVVAGDAGHKDKDTCPKIAYGSNRVTCFVEVAETEVIPIPAIGTFADDGHHHKKKRRKDTPHGQVGVGIVRTVKGYVWSFIWNYMIKDDCPPTMAQLAAILPVLGQAHHAVKCKVEVRWGPDKATLGNTSWEFAGHTQLDEKSLPTKMQWPLPASFKRPDRFISSSREWGVKNDPTDNDALNTFGFFGPQGRDFSQSWGRPVVGCSGNDGFIAFHDDDGHGNNGQDSKKLQDSIGHDKDKSGHEKKDKDKKNQDKKDKGQGDGHGNLGQINLNGTSFKINGYSRSGGSHNTKNLYSCWVFEGHLTTIRTVIIPPTGINPGGKHDDKHDGDFPHGVDGVAAFPAFPAPAYPPRNYAWASCEPQIPQPFEAGEACPFGFDKFDNDKHDEEDDCQDGDCDDDQDDDDCEGQTWCEKKDKDAGKCHDDGCADRKKQDGSDKCHNGACGQKQGNAGDCKGNNKFCLGKQQDGWKQGGAQKDCDGKSCDKDDDSDDDCNGDASCDDDDGSDDECDGKSCSDGKSKKDGCDWAC
ncbi:hypothetical protein C8A03DRAFT_13990 [Achaetomium macrosporum]|uniref:Uncharacterized protein n=1 Tax=Achaetomium macrosporum TaxID=79813 RepID=A0AAN7CES7_9PEZI|nr:hypothetical protein C8A03DRAFT_13990 [Achaetomium macrosporum]